MEKQVHRAEEAANKQEEVIKALRKEIVDKFGVLSKTELQGLTNRIELAATRAKNLRDGSLSPGEHIERDPYFKVLGIETKLSQALQK